MVLEGTSTIKKEFVVERNGRSFVLYAGLLDLAHEKGLSEIVTTLLQVPSDVNGQMAICHATVVVDGKPYSGLGDAAPDSVSRMMLPHLIRMAETRAKARALRDAVNVGTTALEELGDLDDEDGAPAPRARATTPEPQAVQRSLAAVPSRAANPAPRNGSWGGQRGGDFEDDPGPAGHEAAATSSVAGASPATPKQLQTIQRMARAAGKTVEIENLTRSEASQIISGLIDEANNS